MNKNVNKIIREIGINEICLSVEKDMETKLYIVWVSKDNKRYKTYTGDDLVEALDYVRWVEINRILVDYDVYLLIK